VGRYGSLTRTDRQLWRTSGSVGRVGLSGGTEVVDRVGDDVVELEILSLKHEPVDGIVIEDGSSFAERLGATGVRSRVSTGVG
jgi:hypothetical protein